MSKNTSTHKAGLKRRSGKIGSAFTDLRWSMTPLLSLTLCFFFCLSHIHTCSSQRQGASINRMESKTSGCWEWLLLGIWSIKMQFAPLLRPCTPKWQAPTVQMEALRGRRSRPALPGCHYISSSQTHTHTNTHTCTLSLHSQSSVTVWWVPGKQPGRNIQAAPAGLTENLDFVLTYSVFGEADMAARGQVMANRNRAAHSTNWRRGMNSIQYSQGTLDQHLLLLPLLQNTLFRHNCNMISLILYNQIFWISLTMFVSILLEWKTKPVASPGGRSSPIHPKSWWLKLLSHGGFHSSPTWRCV